jgi:hypothetical protein
VENGRDEEVLDYGSLEQSCDSETEGEVESDCDPPDDFVPFPRNGAGHDVTVQKEGEVAVPEGWAYFPCSGIRLPMQWLRQGGTG